LVIVNWVIFSLGAAYFNGGLVTWGYLQFGRRLPKLKISNVRQQDRVLRQIEKYSFVCNTMNIHCDIKDKIQNDGFVVIDDVFNDQEIDDLIQAISQVDTSRPTFRKTNDLFAVRQFLKEVPVSVDILFSSRLTAIISAIFGDEFFVVKSIYFDKPEASNWFVAYHQDLTIPNWRRTPSCCQSLLLY
jgi:hypothetical protein